MVRRTVAALVAVLTSVATIVGVAALPSGKTQASALCPQGYQLTQESAAERAARMGNTASAAALNKALDRVASSQPGQLCQRTKHPESAYDIAQITGQRANAAAAPYKNVPDGAYRAAVEQRAGMVQASATGMPNANGRWTPLGKTPLIADVYPSVAGEGLADLSGRIDSYDYDAAHHRLFATIGTGGVWMSTDVANHWTSIGDGLPSQIVGAVGWVPSGGIDSSVGGTVVVVGGEPINGGDTRTGLGAFWTNNLGDTWHQATGLPDGAMGYQVAPDPAHPSIVYLAT